MEEQMIKIVTPEELLAEVIHYKSEKYRLVAISCTYKEGLEITYSFDKDMTFENIRLQIDDSVEIESITMIYPYAFLYENEIKELFENNNFNTALEYAQECLNICQDMPYAYSLHIAFAYKSIGICYTYMGKEYKAKAEHALRKSFEILYRNLKYNKFDLPRLEAMECENRFVNDSKYFYLRDGLN